MIALLLGKVLAHEPDEMPIYQSYEVAGVVSEAKGRQEVYLLYLYKAPLELGLATEAFDRFVKSIPLSRSVTPKLGIVINPSLKYNYVDYWTKEGNHARTFIPFRKMVQDYSVSKHSVNPEVKARLDTIVEMLNREPTQPGYVNEMKDHYMREGVHHNCDRAINELANIKIMEWAVLVSESYYVQKRLDKNLTSIGDRQALPEWKDIDPKKKILPTGDEVRHALKRPAGQPIDEDDAENDPVVDEGPLTIEDVTHGAGQTVWERIKSWLGFGEEPVVPPAPTLRPKVQVPQRRQFREEDENPQGQEEDAEDPNEVERRRGEDGLLKRHFPAKARPPLNVGALHGAGPEARRVEQPADKV